MRECEVKMKGSFRKSASYGKRQEYSVIAELLKRGFDVYQTLVDDQGIDCIIRIDHNRYLDIQIKASSKIAFQPYNFGGIFVKPRENYFFIFYIEKIDIHYIVPSKDFDILWKKTQKEGKHQGKYKVVIPVKDTPTFVKKKFEKYASFGVLK